MSKNDVAGVGLSPDVRTVIDQLEKEYFASKAGAFKMCVALAIAKNLPLVEPVSTDRAWQAGGAFADLIAFVGWYLDSDAPVKLTETLGHTGLLHIKRDVELGKPFEVIFQ